MAPINLGLWYRGIPFSGTKPGSDALSVLIGVDIDKYDMRIGFSYDVTISKLSIANSLGAFELSLIYEYAKRSKKIRKVLVSCPKF
jgi:hypothetical protein